MQTQKMDAAEARRKLKEFLCIDLIRDPSYPLQDGEPLMSGGLMDSFCVAHLAVFIEIAFGVYIPNTDLTVEAMDTLDLIVARVLQG